MILVLSGESGCGKTTLCRRVVTALKTRGSDVAGVLTLPRLANGEKTGMEIEDVRTGQHHALAERAPVDAGTANLGWKFDDAGLARGAQILRAATPCDVLIMDELGPLELIHAAGWNIALEILQTGHYRAALVVVRPGLVENFRARVKLNPQVLTVTALNREELFNQIVRILDPNSREFTRIRNQQGESNMFNQKFEVILFAVALAACSAPNQPTTVPAPTTAAPSSSAIVVTDAMNRTVKFDKVPQRIVLAGKAFFMVLDALYLFPEVGQRVVGLPEQTQGKTDFYPVIDPNRANKTFFQGADVGPEQILPAKPDVVITKSVNASKLGKSLEQVNIPVVYVDFETPEQYTRDLAILGQLLGNSDRAKKVDAYYKGQVDRVTSKIKNLKDADKPKVLLLQSAEKSGTVAFSIAPADWMQTIIVELAGGQALWKQASDKGGWTIVNLEQIAAWNPDQVFIVNYGGNSKEVVAKLKADPKWQSLKAVKENKIYGFPGDFYTWDQPDTRWGLGLLWLATKIQPALFSDVNIHQEIAQFYALYGLDQATVQSKVTPLLTGDLP